MASKRLFPEKSGVSGEQFDEFYANYQCETHRKHGFSRFISAFKINPENSYMRILMSPEGTGEAAAAL